MQHRRYPPDYWRTEGTHCIPGRGVQGGEGEGCVGGRRDKEGASYGVAVYNRNPSRVTSTAVSEQELTLSSLKALPAIQSFRSSHFDHNI